MKELLVVKRLKTFHNVNNFNYEPTCFDRNIHVRLRTYDEGDVISGLEAKLAFTLEYFLHLFIKSFPSYKVDFKVKDDSDSTKQYIFSKYINEFKQSDIYKQLCVELSKMINFEQILIKPVYSKKFVTTKMTQFGNILDIVDSDLGKSLSDFVDNVMESGSINTFLLNDSISLVISEEVSDNPNEKYLNRSVRKLEKQLQKSNGYQENKLW